MFFPLRLRTVTLYILNTLFSQNTFMDKKATRIPATTLSKARVCGPSLAGVAGSNPAGGMDVYLLWVLCVRSLGQPIPRPEKSYRLVCVCVCVCVCESQIICTSNLSATNRSLVQRLRTGCRVYVCVSLISCNRLWSECVCVTE